MRDKYERIAKRRGAKIAKVAIAPEILTLAFYGLRDGEIRCLARRSRASAKEKLAANSMTAVRSHSSKACAHDHGAKRNARASSTFVMASQNL